MLILKPSSAEQHRASRMVALFGVGTVGSAVARRLTSNNWCVTRRFHLPWAEREQLQLALAAVHDELTQHEQSQDDHPVSLVWCAGRAGFDASAREAANEMAAFEQVLYLFKTVRQRLRIVHWHQISSAGGLFEGQRLVTTTSQPNPRRSYGLLKLQQESALRDLADDAHTIYRLSSVFAPLRQGQRCGLIPTMARNGVLGRTTRIAGRSTTLRDFTWADDIAAFIEREIQSPNQGEPKTLILASGRPMSIGEAHWLIEQALRRRLYVSYVDQHNGSDITYAAQSIPEHFVRTELHGCIRHVCRMSLQQPAQIE